jgi:hypothetical protein
MIRGSTSTSTGVTRNSETDSNPINVGCPDGDPGHPTTCFSSTPVRRRLLRLFQRVAGVCSVGRSDAATVPAQRWRERTPAVAQRDPVRTVEGLRRRTDTAVVFRSATFGFVGASVVALLAIVLWLETGVKEERGLLWGGHVYTQHRDFNEYLRPKGLSYATWADRHPGAARWERTAVSFGPFTLRASTDTREAWLKRLPLAAIGLLLVIGAMLLLFSLVSRFGRELGARG